MSIPLWFQVTTVCVVALFLLVDIVAVMRRPHAPSLQECSSWVGFYVLLALVFTLALHRVSGPAASGAFLAGWLTEYSLSVDNLFVFALIMSQFAVPRANQQKVLMMGILLALVLRAACITAGAAALAAFSWLFYLFGAFLLYTAVKLAFASTEAEDEFHENALVRRLRRVMPLTERYDGAKLFTRESGKRVATPMLLVFVVIGSTDLLFAFDSIPAIFGLTTNGFVVFAATLFALLGLLQLYFLLGALLDRLVYLSRGLAVVLGFIGVKLIGEALAENELPFLNDGKPVPVPHIPIGVSLGVIVGVLALTAILSLVASRRSTPTTRGFVAAPGGAVPQPVVERVRPGQGWPS